jgi:hypothetical protein
MLVEEDAVGRFKAPDGEDDTALARLTARSGLGGAGFTLQVGAPRAQALEFDR